MDATQTPTQQPVNPSTAGTEGGAMPAPDWASIRDEAVGMGDDQGSSRGNKQPEGAAGPEGEAKTLPEPRQQRTKEESIAERLRQKKAKEAARAKLAPVEQQLQQQQQQLQQQQRQWQARQQALQEAAREGKLDQVLKEFGLPTVDEYNRARLTKKGAIAPIDPEVQKQLDELRGYKAQQEKARQEAIAQQRQAAAERQQQAEMQGLVREVESLGIPEATAALGLPGFNQQLYAAISQADDDVTLEQAVSDTMSRYRGLFDTLSSIFNGAPPDQDGEIPEQDPRRRKAARPQGRSRRSPTSLSQYESAEAGNRRPLTQKEEWAMIKAQAARL